MFWATACVAAAPLQVSGIRSRAEDRELLLRCREEGKQAASDHDTETSLQSANRTHDHEGLLSLAGLSLWGDYSGLIGDEFETIRSYSGLFGSFRII